MERLTIAKATGVALALLLLVTTAGQAAERWIIFKAQGGAMGYELDSVIRHQDSGTVTAVIGTYLTKTLDANGIAYNYLLVDNTFRCGEQTYRPSEFVLYSDAMELVDDAVDDPVEPSC